MDGFRARSFFDCRRACTLSGVLLLVLFHGALMAQEPSTLLTPELLWQMERISGARFSPDGQSVLLTVRKTSLEANSGDSDLFILSLEGKDLAQSRQLTNAKTSESDAQWVKTESGVWIFCLAPREGGDQVVSIDGVTGEMRDVTSIPGGVANLKVSPDGKQLAFTRATKLDPDIHDLFPDLPKADAKIFDGLMYRHWNTWSDGTYQHLHIASVGSDGVAKSPRDLMPGLRTSCPVPPFGGSEQFSWAPDGASLAWTMKLVADPAVSTDSDVYTLSVSEEGAVPQCVTTGMNGYDQDPVYSPDGKKLAFLSMERPGFEADRFRVVLLDLASGKLTEATAGVDRSAHDLRFALDGSALYFRSEHQGTEQIFRIDFSDGNASAPVMVTSGPYNWALLDVAVDGRLLLTRQDMTRPPELYLHSGKAGAPFRRLTGLNDDIYATLALPKVLSERIRSTDGAMVQCWVVLPPGFDPARKYPMITYCQGGPQSQIGQSFSARWNFHLMAAKGYVVLAPNRRGLPGFGQAWNDEISGDWGGQAMQDLLAATDAMMTRPWIDASRMACVGASFGGYSVYWMMGNGGDRFRCMIAHCGVFNLESMYGSTEELFFVNWDLGGPYWQSESHRQVYEHFSPHRFVGQWKTPLLVIHGEKDFRVPVTQGMEAFTAAQLSGVPSRFLYFPNEGHWVNQPQNSVLWQRVFFAWLDRFCN